MKIWRKNLRKYQCESMFLCLRGEKLDFYSTFVIFSVVSSIFFTMHFSS